MKTQRAQLNHLRMAPRKVRLVANSLKGLSVNEAEAQLITSPRRAHVPLLKLLRSAVANAKNTKEANPEKLMIKEIRVDGGPMLKRYMPRAMGRATSIEKKTSHVTLVLQEVETLKKPRFTIVAPKKTKKEKEKPKSKSKEEKQPKHEERQKETAKPKASQGFMKRLFRRKSV